MCIYCFYADALPAKIEIKVKVQDSVKAKKNLNAIINSLH
jgi:hypothetical protein